MLNNSCKKIAISKSVYTGTTSVTVASNSDTIKLNKIILSGNTIQDGTPSYNTPIPIQNSNDNGTVVTLQGKNLFDWSAVKSTQIVIEENGRKIIMPIRTESNSNGYTGTGATFRQLFPRLKAGDTATLSFNSNAEIKKIYISTVVVMWASGQTMTVTEDMLDCAVAFYGNYYAHGQTEQVIISDFQMELGTTATAYEPYFNKTVQIPSSVALPGGTSLEMRLAKIGNTADSLAVSRSQNKVIYNQNIGLLTFTGTENILLQSVNDYGFANFYVLLTSDISQGGLCNYFKSQSGSIANIKSEGFLLTSGTLYFRTNKYTIVEDFKTFLSGLYEGGNPLQFEYALKSPVEYDLSDTELGKSLLSLLSVNYTQTVIAKSDSTIPISEIYVDSIHQYESYKTIQYVHESPTSENSSNLQINNNKAIMTINSLELTGGETATTDDIVVTRSGKNLFDYDNVNFKRQNPVFIDPIVTKINNGFKFDCTTATRFAYTTNISAFHLKPKTTYTSRAIVTLINNGSSNIGEAGSMGMSLLLQTNNNFDSSGKGKVYIVDGYTNYNGVSVGTHEIITTFTTPADMTDFKYVVTRVANKTTLIFQDLQIELGDTSSEYEPYFNKTVQIPNTYPLSSTDKLTITKNSVKYNDTDITSEVTGLDEFMKTDTNTAIIDTNYAMGSISADVKKLFVSYKKSIYQADK